MSYRQINYCDRLENKLGETLQDCSILFAHESEVPEKQLDLEFPISEKPLYSWETIDYKKDLSNFKNNLLSFGN